MAIEDPNELDRVLTRRAKEKAHTQAQSRPIAQAVDGDGQVTAWDTATGQTRRLWPVDAAEQLALGKISLVPVVRAEPPDQPPPPEATPAEPETLDESVSAPETVPDDPPASVPARGKTSKSRAKPAGSAKGEPGSTPMPPSP